MPSNFDFLLKDAQFTDFSQQTIDAEKSALISPETAAILCRRSLELAVKWLYRHDDALTLPYKDNLSALIHEPTFRDIIDPQLQPLIQYIVRLGNHAVHTNRTLSRGEILADLKALFAFMQWIAYCYAENYEEREFDVKLVPSKGEYRKPDPEKLQKMADKLSASDEALTAAKRENEKLRQEMEKLRQANQQQRTFAVDEATEAETRRRFIDLDLAEAGWTKGENCQIEVQVEGMPPEPGRTEGTGYCDYVLYGRDKKPLAVVEAKRTARDPGQGAHQAVLYADALEREYKRRPFIFLSNGYETYFLDDTSGEPRRRVGGFFTPDDLACRMDRRKTRKSIAAPELNDAIAGRVYQREAVLAFCEAAEQHQKRMLIVQATGTGKTRVAISITDVLTRYNWAKYILFLADRTALVRQAKSAFHEFFKNKLTLCNLVENKEDPQTSRIVFSTYPTMMNAIDRKRDNKGRRIFSPGHFDLIIIDESHRSIYQKYQGIFDYFDAMLLGLTATPKNEVGRDTYRVFRLEDGVPTYDYDYGTAVSEGYLVDYELKPYTTKFLTRGLHYKELTEEEKTKFEETFGGEPEVLEAGDKQGDIDPSAFNRWLFNKDTVRLVLTRLMEEGIRIEGGDKIGKTVIFAKNTRHASFIVDCFHEMYPDYPDDFIQPVTYQVDYVDDIIERFKKTGGMPQIAVSVDMLDTGIDVPDIVNLVFFKSVYSYSKFWQMIGRGTRLRPDLFGPELDKEYFRIFDYGGNFAYFGEGARREPSGNIEQPLSARVFLVKVKVAKLLQGETGERNELRRLIVKDLETAVSGLNPENFLVREHRRAVDRWQKTDAFASITDLDIAELRREIAPLIQNRGDVEKTRRFDLLMLEILAAAIEDKRDSVGTEMSAVEETAGQLASATLQAIPQVAAHRASIDKLRRPDYLMDADIKTIENLRRELRDLMKYINPVKGFYVISDFDDEIQVAEGTKLKPPQPSENYRRKVEFYLKAHLDTTAVYKLRHNKTLTSTDMKELERIFWQELGTKDDYKRIYKNESLGRLVRQITGMDETSVRDAFREFLAANCLNRSQLDFVEKIITYIQVNGFIDTKDPKSLQQEPFRGVKLAKLFTGKDMSTWRGILETIKTVSGNTDVAS